MLKVIVMIKVTKDQQNKLKIVHKSYSKPKSKSILNDNPETCNILCCECNRQFYWIHEFLNHYSNNLCNRKFGIEEMKAIIDKATENVVI